MTACLALASVSCGDETDAETQTQSIEIEGTWMSNFGGTETITKAKWNDATIISHNNAKNTAITQNAPDAEYGPNAFNKLVWTDVSGMSFFYCTVDFGLATQQAAETSTKSADSSAPMTMGCGGFSWTQLAKQ